MSVCAVKASHGRRVLLCVLTRRPWSVQSELGHVACCFDDAPWNVHTKAHVSVHFDCVVVIDVPLRVAVSLCSRNH